MVVVAMTPRMMVSAFASPAKPKSPSDQSVKVGPMALAGAHRSITMTIRVVASKGRNENARALATADTTTRSPIRRATFASLLRSTSKRIMSPSINIARKEFAFAMGAVNCTIASGMWIPATASTMRMM